MTAWPRPQAISASARAVCATILSFDERGGEGVDEVKVAQVLEDRPAPFGKRGRQASAGLLELAGRGGLHAGGLLEYEPADIAIFFGHAQPVSRRCADQCRAGVARCLGVPSDTGAPSTLICSGPSTPNSTSFSAITHVLTLRRNGSHFRH